MLDNTLPDNVQRGSPEARGTVRVNLFMAATLHASGVESAVKIRDLSATVAQIESQLLPEVGSPMTLSRGRLSVQGHVAWRTERRCGLKFSSKISVPDWMANTVNREQQRVDHIVTAVKAGVVPLAAPGDQGSKALPGVTEDLQSVAQLLECLGDALVGDPAIIAQHGIVLQNLDIAVQTLNALAETMRAGSPVDAASIVRLGELRTSCAEALRGSV